MLARLRAEMRSESGGGRREHGMVVVGKRSEICRVILMALRHRTSSIVHNQRIMSHHLPLNTY